MRNSAIFICLEYVFGYTLSILAILYWPWGNDLDLFGEILIMFLKLLIAIFLGVGLIGFIHLKKNSLLNKYGRSILFCFLGLLLFSIISAFVSGILPGFITLIIPLTGAVTGFNYNLADTGGD